MEIELTVRAEQDLEYWVKSEDKNPFRKYYRNSIFSLGKPELLKHELSGKWSRRITQSDRIIYQIIGDTVYIFSLKGHYKQTKIG